jgi:hypothetical protein
MLKVATHSQNEIVPARRRGSSEVSSNHSVRGDGEHATSGVASRREVPVGVASQQNF